MLETHTGTNGLGQIICARGSRKGQEPLSCLLQTVMLGTVTGPEWWQPEAATTHLEPLALAVRTGLCDIPVCLTEKF